MQKVLFVDQNKTICICHTVAGNFPPLGTLGTLGICPRAASVRVASVEFTFLNFVAMSSPGSPIQKYFLKAGAYPCPWMMCQTSSSVASTRSLVLFTPVHSGLVSASFCGAEHSNFLLLKGTNQLSGDLFFLTTANAGLSFLNKCLRMTGVSTQPSSSLSSHSAMMEAACCNLASDTELWTKTATPKTLVNLYPAMGDFNFGKTTVLPDVVVGALVVTLGFLVVAGAAVVTKPSSPEPGSPPG